MSLRIEPTQRRGDRHACRVVDGARWNDRTCPQLRWASPGDLKSLANIDVPEHWKQICIGSHTLYLVAIGTTWRFVWASSVAAAKEFVGTEYPTLDLSRVRIRRATARHLRAVADWSRKEARIARASA